MQADWERLIALMDGFENAAKSFNNSFQSFPGLGLHVQGPAAHLRSLARQVRDATDRFCKEHDARVPLSCAYPLTNFIQGREPSGDPPGMMGFVVEMRCVQAELGHALAAPEVAIAERCERAFLHLQRLLVADPDVSAKWGRAFTEGEPACEKLGAAHLLHHGVYAFKAHAAHERTDLILGGRVVLDDEEQAGLLGLVLTEWKRVATKGDAAKSVEHAREQAAIYAGSSLAGVELLSTRYLVLVSMDPIANVPARFDRDGASYRVIKLVLRPKTPSRAARTARTISPVASPSARRTKHTRSRT